MDDKKNEAKLHENDVVSENDAAVENQGKINDETRSKYSAKSNEAGPSWFDNLPGTVTPRSTILTKTGLSKSEVNIRKTVTNSDANKITLTSLSFEPNTRKYEEKGNEDKKIDKPQNIIDLKQFVASCFKVNQENSIAPIIIADTIMPVKDIPILPNYTEISETVKNGPKAPNVSLCSDEGGNISEAKANVQTILNEATVQVVNNVGLPSSTIPKLPKVASESSNKKKTSGNTSERSDLGLTQRDSLSSIGSNVCRICMTRGRERLISPCNCKGSLASVHLSCLERWLNQVGRNHCELCGFSYPAIRTPRYTVVQALRLWFGNPRNRSHLQSDCLIFWLLSTVTAGLLAVCIVGNQYFVMGATKNGIINQDLSHGKVDGTSHSITETAMNFFMAIVLCGYSVTVYLLWKDHYVMWNRWRRANVNVQLLLSPDSNPVPFVPRPQYNNVSEQY